jgi:hypothetical protein
MVLTRQGKDFEKKLLYIDKLVRVILEQVNSLSRPVAKSRAQKLNIFLRQLENIYKRQNKVRDNYILTTLRDLIIFIEGRVINLSTDLKFKTNCGKLIALCNDEEYVEKKQIINKKYQKFPEAAKFALKKKTIKIDSNLLRDVLYIKNDLKQLCIYFSPKNNKDNIKYGQIYTANKLYSKWLFPRYKIFITLYRGLYPFYKKNYPANARARSEIKAAINTLVALASFEYFIDQLKSSLRAKEFMNFFIIYERIMTRLSKSTLLLFFSDAEKKEILRKIKLDKKVILKEEIDFKEMLAKTGFKNAGSSLRYIEKLDTEISGEISTDFDKVLKEMLYVIKCVRQVKEDIVGEYVKRARAKGQNVDKIDVKKFLKTDRRLWWVHKLYFEFTREFRGIEKLESQRKLLEKYTLRAVNQKFKTKSDFTDFENRQELFLKKIMNITRASIFRLNRLSKSDPNSAKWLYAELKKPIRILIKIVKTENRLIRLLEREKDILGGMKFARKFAAEEKAAKNEKRKSKYKYQHSTTYTKEEMKSSKEYWKKKEKELERKHQLETSAIEYMAERKRKKLLERFSDSDKKYDALKENRLAEKEKLLAEKALKEEYDKINSEKSLKEFYAKITSKKYLKEFYDKINSKNYAELIERRKSEEALNEFYVKIRRKYARKYARKEFYAKINRKKLRKGVID